MKTKRLECVLCGTIAVIQRKDSKDRAAGHIKHMYCPGCKARRPHKELDEFSSEFSKNVNEFDSMQRVMTQFLQPKSMETSGSVKGGDTCDTQEVILSNRAREQSNSEDSF